MIFMFDNNLPPTLAHGIRELSRGRYKDDSIFHLKDHYPPEIPDIEWIQDLSSGKGPACVLTQDLLNKGMEAELLSQSGLIVFFLAKGWASEEHWLKASRLVRWWPRIVEQAYGVHKGACFRVPINFGTGKFEQVKR